MCPKFVKSVNEKVSNLASVISAYTCPRPPAPTPPPSPGSATGETDQGRTDH